jgi:hypothetical protein
MPDCKDCKAQLNNGNIAGGAAFPRITIVSADPKIQGQIDPNRQ